MQSKKIYYFIDFWQISLSIIEESFLAKANSSDKVSLFKKVQKKKSE